MNREYKCDKINERVNVIIKALSGSLNFFSSNVIGARTCARFVCTLRYAMFRTTLQKQ